MVRALDERLKRLDLGDRLIRRNPLYYGSVHRQFVGLEQAGIARRKAWTQTRLRKILQSAARTAYGRSVRGTDDIASWPLLEKAQVRENPQAFCSGRSWFTAHASTGGTTGMPLQLVRSPEAIVAEQVCLDRMIGGLGIDPMTARTAVLRGDNIKDPSDMRPPFWRYALGGRRLSLSSNHLTEATLGHYLRELREFKPDLLWVYPSSLELLCRLIAASGESLQIPRVLSSSEVLSPASWLLARQVLGCKIADYYGQAERIAFAFAFAPTQYFFLPGYAYVELLPHSTEGSVTLYEIVGTSLWNEAMPLVRYRTGDLLRLPAGFSREELDQLVYGTRAFEGVIGRDQEVLYAPDRMRVLTGIDHIQRDVEHIVRIQVVQEALDRVLIRVVPAQGFVAADAQRLERNARNKIPRSIDVRIEVTEILERTQQGKTPFVIHRPEVRDAVKQSGLTAPPDRA
jgi:phenylacetate-CoA ligase